MPKVNQAEFARLLGINKVQVHSAVSKGILELEDDGLLDFDAAVAALEANGDPLVAARLLDDAQTPLMREIRENVANGGPEAGDGIDSEMPSSYQKARALKEKYAALRVKLKYEEEKRLLLSAAEVESVVSRVFKTVADELGVLPDTLERDFSLEPAVILRVERTLDQIRYAMHEAIVRLVTEPDPPPADA